MGKDTGCYSGVLNSDVLQSYRGPESGGPINISLGGVMDPRGKQPTQGGQAIPIDPSDPSLPPKVREVLHKGRTSWLKNPEVCDLLVNHAAFNLPISRDAPMQPPGTRTFRSFHHNLCESFCKTQSFGCYCTDDAKSFFGYVCGSGFRGHWSRGCWGTWWLS